MTKRQRTVKPRAKGYFVTGGTGFIGRHLIQRLLEHPGRTVHVLVRAQSLPLFEKRLAQWGAEGGRVTPVVGELTSSGLGLTPQQLRKLTGRIEHFFHVAGLYDMAATVETLEQVNVTGTSHAVEAAQALGARCFHHVSSIAAAGRYPGTFREDMFDEAVGLEDPYFRTKHESERVVRKHCSLPWRIYRPALVVGHSESGEMDKVDGPYYFFPIIEQIAASVPAILPLPGIDGGFLNIVPVDFVAAAIDRIAHVDGLDGKTFHLADPQSHSVGEVLNIFAEAAGGPPFSLRVSGVEEAVVPLAHLVARAANSVGGGRFERSLGIPPRILDYVGNPTTFDCQNTLHALRGSGIAVPRLETYATRLWQYWERNLNTNTGHARALERVVRGKHVLITGASSGIGRAVAVKLSSAGAHLVLVARDQERLAEVQRLVERLGGRAAIFSVDLTDDASTERLCREVVKQFGGVDILINNAGRSIRRSLRISQNRFHDFTRTMEINYFGALRLILGLVPAMRKKRSGHIINVSSIGAQVGPPRFSAYIASKSALDGFSRCAAPELLGDGIDITTVYMPLVKTEMIAPTRLYDSFSTITPAQAADLICEAIIDRPKQVTTALGMVGQVTASVAPRIFDVALYLAYRLFPDSSAAHGGVSFSDEQPSSMGRVFARLLPGVHW